MTTLQDRVKLINDALVTLSHESAKELDPVAQPAIDAALSVLGSLVISLSEIASSVGKLVEIAERDFSAQVSEAAEQKATIKHEAISKRSFIGQPQKSD